MTREIRMSLQWMFIALALAVAMSTSNCGGGNDRNIDDCSRRGRPQHRDGAGHWTCE